MSIESIEGNGGKVFLLTGGRAPVTLDLARQFHACGHRVVIAESQPHFLSRPSKAVDRFYRVSPPRQKPEEFLADLRAIIEKEGVDVLIPTCEEVFYVARGRELLSAPVGAREDGLCRAGRGNKVCRVWVDDSQKLGRLHSKWAFNRKVADLGLPAPRTALVTDVSQLLRRANEALSEANAVVLKPVFSRFAAKTLILSQKGLNGFNSRKSEALPPIEVTAQNPWVVQEFISGREICTYSLAEAGRLLAHVTYSHEFTAGKGAGICFESLDHPASLEWVREFVRAENFTGQISFDFIETSGGGLYPLECNPRATSGGHLFAAPDRLDLVFLGEEAPLGVLRPRSGSAAMLGIAMLVYGLPSIRSWKGLKNWLSIFSRAREAIMSFADPWPVFYQFYCIWNLWIQSLWTRERKSILEMSTHDIEWNGEIEGVRP